MKIVGAILLALAFASSADAEEYLKSDSVTGRADVHVHVDDSSVHILTSDTNQIEFRVTSEGSVTFNIGGKLRIDSQQNGNQVELTVLTKPGISIGFNDKRLRTEIRMPQNADLQVETTDGSVEISSVNGNIAIQTTDGSVKAAELTGKSELRTVDGSINVETLTGESKLHSVDGAIGVAHFDGKCAASSTDGAIHLSGRFDSLDIKSTDGGVVAKVAPGSRMSSAWSIRTVDGSVELTLPQDFQANLDASTRDGHISLGLPVSVQGNIGKTEVRGTLNGGGPALAIHTGDGSIHIESI
jgi:DUF4097 and DUF4098 domain-containing protein YvlB